LYSARRLNGASRLAISCTRSIARAVVEARFTLADPAAAPAAWFGLDGARGFFQLDSLPLGLGYRDVVLLMDLHNAKVSRPPSSFLVNPAGGGPPGADISVGIDQESENSWAREAIAGPEDWDALEQ
jgi:hypothetical protein